MVRRRRDMLDRGGRTQKKDVKIGNIARQKTRSGQRRGGG